MISEQMNNNDPLNFMRNMWGNMGFNLPGMVTPTFDVDELEKRITDLKAVEGWLRMNLSMLQMTIQGLEMQKTTLSAVKAMGSMAANAHQNMTAAAAQPAAPEIPEAAPEGAAPLWPWALMKEMQEQLQQQAAVREAKAAATAAAEAAAAAAEAGKKPAARKPRGKTS